MVTVTAILSLFFLMMQFIAKSLDWMLKSNVNRFLLWKIQKIIIIINNNYND